MADAVAVVALDAADYALAREWDCQNILLDQSSPLETDNYAHTKPLTTEVWPAIATGRHVSEFGEVSEQQWDNPILRLGSKVTQYFPPKVRRALGAPFRLRGARTSFTQASADHPFDATFSWPGITEARHLDKAWMLMRKLSGGEMTEREVLRQMRENTGQEFGWAAVTATPETPLVGVHSHILDVAGHTYGTRTNKLRAVYEWVDTQLGWLRNVVSELVVVSDHGMQNAVMEDDEPGIHSWRALISATKGLTGDLPETIYDVSGWLSDNRPKSVTSEEEGESRMDVPTEHLQDLGYLE